MIVDLDCYRVNIPTVKQYLEQKADRGLDRIVSELGVTTNCPLIVICFFIGEIQGFDEPLKVIIRRLRDFYRYTDVTGVRGEKPCFGGSDD